MGDNANKQWEWHNNAVGKGYQARGVVRQPGSAGADAVQKVVDMTPSHDVTKVTEQEKSDHRKRKHSDEDQHQHQHQHHSRSGSKANKHSKNKSSSHDLNRDRERKSKSKHSSHRHRDHRHSASHSGSTDRKRSSSQHSSFNPLLQLFASHISDSLHKF